MKVAIIGGGAAGFFASFSVKKHHKNSQVTLFEKSNKLLSKLKVSGGGRCNVTHHCLKTSQLSKFYPRGESFLKKSFSQFHVQDTIDWFEARNVALKTEDDNRMFPITDNSQTIINCFLKEAQDLDIKILTESRVSAISKLNDNFRLEVNKEIKLFDKVIIATGGSPKIKGFDWLNAFNLPIVDPVPSLFTFNMPEASIKELMGVVVENTSVRIQSTKLEYQGPVLITHWGMSGPAVLKLSAWGARYLKEKNYQFTLQINWLSIKNEDQVKLLLDHKLLSIEKKKIKNTNPFSLPSRIWNYLVCKIGVDEDIFWKDISKKDRNKIVNVLLNDTYNVSGKTTFKEEFVTCGGVSLEEINPNTMSTYKYKNLYFAGEILDIDGITGGFNFQAAWTTGFIAGKLL